MTALIGAVAATPLLVIAGWGLVVILWETTALGVVLAAWRLVHPRASARQQYAAGVLALGAAVVLAVVTPPMLMAIAPSLSAGQGSRTAGTAPPGPGSTHRGTGDAVVIPPESPGESRASPDALAGAAGLIWAGGVLLLGVRLLGGAMLAASVRKRARPIVNESARQAAEALRADLRLPAPVSLLQSEHVEAPVIIGWRRPALILPADVTDRLTPDMIDAVLAHEFAHIERRDYIANLLQSIVELLLFFSPAVAWMSRRIREAREYCCDDAAIHRCGDPKHYVQALTTLASLATVNTVRPALGAAGPRLIVRVRRLLQEETMPRFSSMRLLALGATLIVLVVTGIRVTAASAAYASRVVTNEGPGARIPQTHVPFGWATEQDGSGVVLGPFVFTEGTPEQKATVRNTTNATISALRFIAVVEGMPRSRVRIFTSEMMPVSIAPGQSADIAPNTISPEQLEQAAAASSGRVQVFFGLQAVKFVNGAEWQITPNLTATYHQEALGLSREEIPRALLGTVPAASVMPDSACRDQNGRAYSQGALVPLRNEPGRFARCNNRRWEESTIR
jgi:beta-lactamase regulating signal transducer with metallopeptidase domain